MNLNSKTAGGRLGRLLLALLLAVATGAGAAVPAAGPAPATAPANPRVDWVLTTNGTPATGGYQVENWDTDDGLPQNSVTAICQTRDGYLWLGTQNGLARFDGVRFKIFSPDTIPAFPGNRITCLFEDAERRLWFGVEGGSVGFLVAGQFEVPGKFRIPDNTVTCIAQGGDGALWFGTVRGDVLRQAGAETRVFGRADGLPGKGVRGLVVDAEGLVWATTEGWLGTLEQGRFAQHPWAVTGETTMAARRPGGVWLADQSGVARVARAAGQWFYRLPETERVRSLVEDRNGAVWLGLAGGGLRHLAEGAPERIGAEEGLDADPVLALGQDTEGNLWVGIQNGGLIRVRQRVIGLLDRRHGLRNDNVFSVCEDADGGMWLGTDAGLHWLRPGAGLTRFGTEHGLRNEHVTAVWEDRRRTLWVGTWGGGLYRRNGERFEPAGNGPEAGNKFIRAIYEDALGNLWIGTQLNGAYCLDAAGRQIYATAAGLSHSDVRAIWRDRSGTVWFGTGGGGLSWLRDGKLATLTTAEGLPSNFVRVLFEDEAGSLWVGTAGGLARVRNGRVVALRSAHGLPDTVISQIFTDQRGLFWFGSNRGIFRVPARELAQVADGEATMMRCFIYNKTDGLGGRECNGGFQPAGCRTRDGRLWFPTPKGVAMVEPGKMRLNAHPPRVIIEEVVADGKPLDFHSRTDEPPPRAGQVSVPANCQRLEIRYTAINFTAPRRLQFIYGLGNYGADWVEAGTERVAVYLQPPPGERLFEVRAVSSDGVWSQAGPVLAVTIAAPYWRTWWFLGLAVAAATALLLYGFRLVSLRQMRRSLEVLERQQALATERSRIAADMHDQLGSRLTHISLLGELARREVASPETVSRQLDKITAQSRELARSLDEIVWTVNPGNDTLEQTAAYLVHFTEEFFEPTTVRCRLDVPAQLPDRVLSADRRHQLFLAFKEALTNVARHAGATEVTVRVSAGVEWLQLEIRDNGRGFTPAAGVGNGLGNLRSRIAAIDGRAEVTSQPGQGTQVTFFVPLTPAVKRGQTRFGRDARSQADLPPPAKPR